MFNYVCFLKLSIETLYNRDSAISFLTVVKITNCRIPVVLTL